MTKQFYSFKVKNSKLIMGFSLFFSVCVFSNLLNGQTTLYSENMDNGSGGSNGDAISLHETNGRFQQVGLTYSGTGDMRNTLPSSGYATASGGFNVLLNSTGETFIIDGLNLSSCLSEIVVSFGVNKSTNLSDGSKLSLQYSTTGVTGSFTTIKLPLLPTGSGTATGYYYVSTTSLIPSDVTTLRFAATDGTSYRIDDVLIECNTATCVPPSFIVQPIDKSICEGDGFQLYAPAEGTNPITYQWQVDSGSGFVDLTDDATYTGSLNDTLIAVNAVGSMDGYLYRCVATEGSCSSISDTSTLNIDVVATPTITATGPTTFCQGGSVVLTSSSTTGNLWNNQSNSTTQSIVVTQSGDYIVKVTVGLCSKKSAPTTVKVEDATFTIGTVKHPTLCGTPDGEIEMLGNQAGEVTYGTYSDFYPTDPIIAAVTKPATLTYLLNGLIRGNWEITFTTPIGCVFKDSVLLTAGLPVPTISSSIKTLSPDYRAEFCAPDSIELISSSDVNNTWQRYSVGTWTDFASTQSIIVKTTDTVRVSVTSGPCTEFSDTAFVLVNRQPIISVNAFSDPTTCGALDGTIEILGDTTGTLIWSGPVSSSMAVDLDTAPNTVTITGLKAGSYIIKLNDGTCVSDTVIKSLKDPGAPAEPVISADGPTTFCDGGSVNLSITAVAGETYAWFNGSTQVAGNVTTLNVTASGTYTVTATASSCTSTSAAQIVTENLYPNVPSISSSDDNDSICTGTSITLTSSLASSYLWTPNGETTRSITVSAGSNYSVSVTENGCTSTSVIRPVYENDSTLLVFGTINNPSICGSSDATVQILKAKESTENLGDLTWSGPVSGSATNISLSFIITSLSSGLYDITFNTPGGCTGYSQLTITDPISIPTISLATGDVVTFCEGGDVTLISSSSVGNQWTLNGNPITGATGQTYTTGSSGIYAVNVTVGTCTTSSLDTIVNVIALPIISTGILTAPSQCGLQDGIIEIMGTGTGDMSWTGKMTGDSLGLDFSSNINVQNVFAGDYTFVFDNGTCTSLPLNLTLNENSVPAKPTVTASGPTTFCDDNGSNSVTLTASLATGSYRWSNGVTGVNNITVNQSSNYYVVVTEGACSDSSDVINVSVINNPATPSIAANGATTICQGSSVILTASASTGVLWSNGATTPTVSIVNSATLTAIVSENGCNSATSNAITVTVNPNPPTPTISSSTGVFEFCEGGSLQLTSSATSGNLWSNGVTSQSHAVSNDGMYYVTVTTNGCSSTSATVTVNEKNMPVATLAPYNQLCDTNAVFTLNQGVVSDFTIGVSITTSYTVNGSVASTFDPGNGVGTYTVVFTATEAGCSDSDSQIITVVHCEALSELNENALESLQVYPNPTSSHVTISGEALSLIKQILIVDGLGRTVITENVNSTVMQLDLSYLADGMYSIMLKDASSLVSLKRIQVIK